MSTLGENIAALRKNKGITQEKLAETIGISPQSVSKWENDISMPDISLLPVLADIFSVSIDALLGKTINRTFDGEGIPENIINYETITVWRVDKTHKMLNVYTMLIAAELIKSGDKYHCYCGSKNWCF